METPGADIVDSPFTTTVLPGPTSAVRASGSLRWIMANQPNPPATQRPEVDSLITGTGLQYAEAGVEAGEQIGGPWKKNHRWGMDVIQLSLLSLLWMLFRALDSWCLLNDFVDRSKS